MIEPKFLSADEIAEIVSNYDFDTTGGLKVIAVSDLESLFAHIAAQGAEIALLRMIYRNAMESARRSAWNVAEWDFKRNDNEDLAAIGYENAAEWTEELKALAERSVYDSGTVTNLTEEIERLRAIPESLHRYGQVSADIDHQFVEETDKGEFLKYDDVIKAIARK